MATYIVQTSVEINQKLFPEQQKFPFWEILRTLQRKKAKSQQYNPTPRGKKKTINTIKNNKYIVCFDIY